jgi:hypothetical protein
MVKTTPTLQKFSTFQATLQKKVSTFELFDTSLKLPF